MNKPLLLQLLCRSPFTLRLQLLEMLTARPDTPEFSHKKIRH
ncbi:MULTISPECIES: hypothetical protein [Erwinia]|uniref:Transcriptional regulator n=1 Tax=Erwinia papayae TaxID=206499 RepID=A0ABV3MWL6_9GAMM|nr:hypothetical protein [Erwinia mallotivora]